MKLDNLILRGFNILACAAGALFLFTGVLLAYDLQEYLPLAEGNTWVYKMKNGENGVETTDQEINKVKGTEKIGEVETVKVISNKTISKCIAIDDEGAKMYKYWGWSGGEYEVCSPPKMLFPNISLGESRTYPIQSAQSNIDDVVAEGTMEEGTLTITLDSVEDIDTPIGKFKDCLKFSSVYEFKKVHRPESGKETMTIWLAPGVGKVKSDEAFSEYNAETKKEAKSTELLILEDATINGNKVSIEKESPAAETPPEVQEGQS